MGKTVKLQRVKDWFSKFLDDDLGLEWIANNRKSVKIIAIGLCVLLLFYAFLLHPFKTNGNGDSFVLIDISNHLRAILLTLIFGFVSILSLVLAILVYKRVSEPIETVGELIEKAIPEIEKTKKRLQILCISPNIGQSLVENSIWERYKKAIHAALRRDKLDFYLISSSPDIIEKFVHDRLEDVNLTILRRRGVVKGAYDDLEAKNDFIDKTNAFFRNMERNFTEYSNDNNIRKHFIINDDYDCNKYGCEFNSNTENSTKHLSKGMPEFTIIDVDYKVFITINQHDIDGMTGYVVTRDRDLIIHRRLIDHVREACSNELEPSGNIVLPKNIKHVR